MNNDPKQIAAMQPWTTNVVVESLAVVIREVMEKYVAYCKGDVGQLRAFFSAIENRNSGFCCDHIVVVTATWMIAAWSSVSRGRKSSATLIA